MKINTNKLFLRLLVSPFILCVFLITFIYHLIIRFFNYLIYGGEFINYSRNERQSIESIYNSLKHNHENNPNKTT